MRFRKEKKMKEKSQSKSGKKKKNWGKKPKWINNIHIALTRASLARASAASTLYLSSMAKLLTNVFDSGSVRSSTDAIFIFYFFCLDQKFKMLCSEKLEEEFYQKEKLEEEK